MGSPQKSRRVLLSTVKSQKASNTIKSSKVQENSLVSKIVIESSFQNLLLHDISSDIKQMIVHRQRSPQKTKSMDLLCRSRNFLTLEIGAQLLCSRDHFLIGSPEKSCGVLSSTIKSQTAQNFCKVLKSLGKFFRVQNSY